MNGTVEELKGILDMRYSPVGARFIKDAQEMPMWAREYDVRPMRACQMLMEAKHGNRVVLTADNTACPAARTAFGFAPLPEKISSGKMLSSFGIFGSNEAGQHTMAAIPHLEEALQAVVASPLEKADFEPHVVVVEDTPEVIMWLLLADIHREGGRHTLSTSVIQACCIDVTSYVYSTGATNASFGCYGCREASDLKEDEAMIGVPYEKWSSIVEAIQAMNEKGTIDKVRTKGIYNIYAKKGEDTE